MENFRKDGKNLVEYLQQERQKNRYDPRSDLEEDHKFWQLILKKAEKQDKQIYSNLHGFRIAGCRIKIIPGTAVGQYWQSKDDWKQDRYKYLLPYKDKIKAIFEAVQQELNDNESNKETTI